MPPILEPAAANAKAKLRRSHLSPGVAVDLEKLSEFGYRVASPHQDHESWEAMVCDALGTRSVSTAKTFLYELTGLCSQNWHPAEVEGEYGQWCPDERELNMVLNMVAGIKPRNELEAAQAAQMVAVHLMTMRVAARALSGGVVTPQDAAIAGKLARTFVMQADGLARLRGRKPTTKQTIIVRQEKHVHTHQHVHIEGGDAKIGGQPHAKDGDAPLASLLSDVTPGPAVPLACGERKARVPDARRSKRHRSSKGVR